MGNSANEIEKRYSKHTSSMLAPTRMKGAGTNRYVGKTILNDDGSIDIEETEQFQRELRGLPRTKPPKPARKPTKEQMDAAIEEMREEMEDEVGIEDSLREIKESDFYKGLK